MKKIFSAFLLMTMMVASVGSFVSCSDIEDAIAKVEGTATENAAQIKDLESKIAALQTALATAQADAAAAKAEANAAKQAAATAKAEAIEAALAEIAKVQDDVDAANAEIKKINDALAGYATKEAVELLENTVAEYKALTDENAEAIEAIEAELAALKEAGLTAEKFAEVVAKMEQIDKDLVAFVDALKDLANRIQSITWVPATEAEHLYGAIAPFAFKVPNPATGEKKTPVMIQTTYQVAPVDAIADVIGAEVFFSTSPIAKAGDQVTFDAEVVAVDAERGQFTVRGYITEDSEAYAYLTKKQTSYKTDFVAALNVVTDNSATLGDETVETGSYVTSPYVQIYGPRSNADVDNMFANVYERIYLAKVTNSIALVTGQDVSLPVIEVPYNDPNTERAMFANYMFVVYMPETGAVMTLEQTAELLGTELDVTYNGAASADKYNNQKPVAITGKDLASTAKIVPVTETNGSVADVKKLVGYTGSVKLSGFKVNKYSSLPNVPTSVTSTYKIANAKAGITFESVKHSWTPSETSSADYKLNGTEFKAVELAVTTSNIDLTGRTFAPVSGTYNFKATSGNNTAYAKVRVLSSKAVMLDEVEIPYLREATGTWKFRGSFVDDATKTTYEAEFTFELGGMPKDKTINLGASKVVPSGVKMEIPAPVLAEILNADAAYYGENDATVFFKKGTDGNVLATDNVPQQRLITAVDNPTVLWNDNESATIGDNSVHYVPSIKRDSASKPWYENSYLWIDPETTHEYGDIFIITQKFSFAGIVYEFKSVVEFEKPTVSIVPNPTYVKDGVVTLGGKVTYPTSTEAAKTPGTAFALNEVNLNDYVNVTVPSGMAADYKLKYTIKTAKVKYDGTNYTELPTLTGETNGTISKGITEDAKVAWGTSKLNEVEYEIALTSATGVVLGDPVKIKLQIPELAVLSVGESVKSTYTNNVASSANVAGALVVKDKDGNNIYNAGFVNSLNHVVENDVYVGINDYYAEYYSYDKDGNKTGISSRHRITDGWKMYGQTFALPMKDGAVDKSKITVTVNGAAATIDYTITADGTITVGANNANVTGDIVFTVPVSMNYLFDGYAAQTVNAQVVFEVE